MGIESDQLVFDYLSRVGDLAQQQQLTSGDRMRLVSSLRTEIDRQRAKAIGGPDSAAAVQRILGRLGTPDEIVEAAAGGSGVEEVLSSRTSRRVLPRQRRSSAAGEDRGDGRGAADGWGARDGRGAKGAEEPVGFEKAPTGRAGPSGPEPFPTGPHVAGTDELGPPGKGPEEWWRADPGPFGGLGTSVPGFTGGVEIPEILKPPPEDDEDEDGDGDKDGEGGAATEDAGEDERSVLRRLADRRARRRAPVAGRKKAARDAEEAEEDLPVRAPLVPRGSPFLLLAAVLLVAGAVVGNLLVLAGGWLLAYLSRKLSRAEAKWAVLGLPGLVAAGGAVWLWGRSQGRWGEQLSMQAEGALTDALTGLWPVLVRTAAVVSAVYLVWRARRIGG
ncbi:hypothetical protein ACFYVL_10325 [Streptomyces sp. NPDC004111]|uniref:hypothetical protein n=1 Tax=Streptomyces sp. NPDC004111 TaxID=3364690 RepID=UPI0036BDBA92